MLYSLDAIQLLPGVRQAQTDKPHFPYGLHRTQNDARVLGWGGAGRLKKKCDVHKSFVLEYRNEK